MYLLIGSLMLAALMLGAACSQSPPPPTATPTLTHTATPTSQPSPTPTATPTPTPQLSPQSILQESLNRLAAVESYHIEMDMEIKALMEAPLNQEITMSYEIIGDIQAPDRAHATMLGDILGMTVEAEYIMIRDEMHVLNHETGKWESFDQSLAPFNFEDFLGIEPGEIEELQLIGEEMLDGAQVYHLKANTPPGAEGALGVEAPMGMGVLGIGDEIEYIGEGGEVEYWIGVDDFYLKQMSSRVGIRTSDESAVSLIEDVDMIVRLSEFGQELLLPDPAARQPTPTPVKAQPTPVGVTLSELLGDALAATSEEDSYHLITDAQLDTRMGGIRTRMPFISFEGDFQSPNRLVGSMMSGGFFGSSVDSDVIVIGDTAYILNPETGVWEEDLTYRVFPFLPQDVLMTDISEIEDLIFIGEEELDGIQVYHLRGGLPDITLDGTETLSQVDYWIEVNDSRLRRIAQITEQAIPGAAFPVFGDGTQEIKSAIGIVVEFSDFGKPVTIDPPIE